MSVDTIEESPPQTVPAATAVELRELALVNIFPSQLNPRKHFEQAALTELTDSIRLLGVQQPIVVRVPELFAGHDHPEHYEIIMGERRYRAAERAGLATIPALVRTGVDDAELVRLALEENTKRRDLSALEEAEAYAKLLELEPSLTQEGLAKRLGVSQSKVANTLRLRGLPLAVKTLLERGDLSGSHGVTLCSIAENAPEECTRLALTAAEEDWPQSRLETEVKTVRSLEEAKRAEDEIASRLPLDGDNNTDPVDDSDAEGETETEEEAATAVAPAEDEDEAAQDADTADAGTEPEPVTPAAATAGSGDALTKPVEAPPATPAVTNPPATAGAGGEASAVSASAEPEPVKTPGGPSHAGMTARVATSISADDSDWLWEENLTIDQALQHLRSSWAYRLTPLAIKCLKALTDQHNEAHPEADLPASPSARLESILAVRATQAGFDIEVLESIPE